MSFEFLFGCVYNHIIEVLNLLVAQGCGSHTAERVIDSPQWQCC